MKNSGKNHPPLKGSPYDSIDEAAEETFPTSDPPSWTLGSNQEIIAATSDSNDITQILANEHHHIRKSIAILSKLIASLKAGKKIDASTFQQLNDFFFYFVARCHYEKKEMLFLLLKQGENHPSDYILRDLKLEHDMGRLMFGTFNKMIGQYQKTGKLSVNKFTLLLKEILNLHTNHVSKEEEYILPAIMRIVSLEDQMKLLQAFHQVDDKVQLAEKKRLIESLEVLMQQLC